VTTREVCVITGGTRGIGEAVARRLVHRTEHALVLGYRADTDAALRLAGELTQRDRPVVAVRCDVTRPDDVEKLFVEADQVARLCGLVNCAGSVEGQSAFEEISYDRWNRTLAVNVVGTALTCRAAVGRMRTSTASVRSIVNVSSKAAVLGAPHEYVDYAASKAAVDTLTRGLALEVAGAGIRVNCVRPGIIETQFHAAVGDPQRAARLGPQQPMGRAGTADEVASAVEWLLSADSSFVTGTTLDVSGGR
jgi:NAD(P)-dependent dehydrogenase (short-subunit alcohol dehydrogenase family)